MFRSATSNAANLVKYVFLISRLTVLMIMLKEVHIEIPGKHGTMKVQWKLEQPLTAQGALEIFCR
jgi:hypothetical protein